MTTDVAEVPPDHFSARAEPGFRRDQRSIWQPSACSEEKDRISTEQNVVVAASSQSRTICAPALPRSNQIEATLFD
jgi:hypothetical protein